MQSLMSICIFVLLGGGAWAGEYLGCLNCSEYDPDSVQNPYGKYGLIFPHNRGHRLTLFGLASFPIDTPPSFAICCLYFAGLIFPRC